MRACKCVYMYVYIVCIFHCVRYMAHMDTYVHCTATVRAPNESERIPELSACMVRTTATVTAAAAKTQRTRHENVHTHTTRMQTIHRKPRKRRRRRRWGTTKHILKIQFRQNRDVSYEFVGARVARRSSAVPPVRFMDVGHGLHSLMLGGRTGCIWCVCVCA